MTRFSRGFGLFEGAHVSIHAIEVVADDVCGSIGTHLARLGQIYVAELRELRFGRDVIVFGAEPVELRRGHEAWRLGALEPDELLELPDWRERDEVELLPQAVDLTLLTGVEDQLV